MLDVLPHSGAIAKYRPHSIERDFGEHLRRCFTSFSERSGLAPGVPAAYRRRSTRFAKIDGQQNLRAVAGSWAEKASNHLDALNPSVG